MAKCHVCGEDVPFFGNVMWCNDCIDEFLDSQEEMQDFIARKKAAR